MGFKRTVVPMLLTGVVLGAAATEARATLRIENHLDPAGDPTIVSYRVDGPTWSSGAFPLIDGDYKSFGPDDAGTYVLQALLPAGWGASDIKCVGPSQGNFTIDLPNARVTVRHTSHDDQACAFTHRRVGTNGTVPQQPGVAPTPRPEEVPKVEMPDRPEVLDVAPGRRSAGATVRLVRRTVVKARLQTKRGKVLRARRIERNAGTYTLRLRLSRKDARRLARRNGEDVTLTVRIVMIERDGVTRVFRHGVVVRL